MGTLESCNAAGRPASGQLDRFPKETQTKIKPCSAPARSFFFWSIACSTGTILIGTLYSHRNYSGNSERTRPAASHESATTAKSTTYNPIDVCSLPRNLWPPSRVGGRGFDFHTRELLILHHENFSPELKPKWFTMLKCSATPSLQCFNRR